MDYRFVDPRELKIDECELCARLSVRSLEELDFSELYDRLISEAKPAYAAVRVELYKSERGIRIGSVTTESQALRKLTEGASDCIVLAATLGIGVDRLIYRASKLSHSEAFVLDAIADALIESLCDLAEAEVCQGLYTTGRFSPGYADLELSVGYEILSLCSAEKILGIKTSDSGLMIPKKSVNALIAIKDE